MADQRTLNWLLTPRNVATVAALVALRETEGGTEQEARLAFDRLIKHAPQIKTDIRNCQAETILLLLAHEHGSSFPCNEIAAFESCAQRHRPPARELIRDK